MDEGVVRILAGISLGELEKVAAGALGAPSVLWRGTPAMTEITKPHYDNRTIGIVKVSGIATLPPGGEQAWSAVAKIIDLSVAPRPSVFVHPENEEMIYERRLFADDGLSFRPARCYHVSRPSPQFRVLWLEDLSGLDAAPFDVRQLAVIARDFGLWNGFHAPSMLDLPFVVPTNTFITRWQKADFGRLLPELNDLRDHPYTKQSYGNLPTSIAAELLEAMTALNSRTGTLLGSLAFGDCTIGNLFWNGRETIAVDWASLCSDPLGVDAGCAIGSAVTFGKQGAEITASERFLFNSYMDGLRAAGWRGNDADVRRAYFGQFAVYLMYAALMPVFLSVPGKHFSRVFLEKRYQTSWEEIARLVYPTIRLLPGFLSEIGSLQ